MLFDIQIDPIATLENQYRETLEKGTEPYPTLADFDVNTPLELLEQYPIIPFLWTVFKIERQNDVTHFLKLQKPIANLPQTEQKELIRYIRELAVVFVPIYGMVKNLTGNNAYERTGPLNNGIGFYLQSFGTALIKELKLGFTEEDIFSCEKCRDPKCHPYTAICADCHFPHFSCDRESLTYHRNRDTTCDVCGETHAVCLEHVQHPGQESCTVYRRKSPLAASPPFENGEIVTVETRRLLRCLKEEVREIIKEIHHQFPTLVDFHNRLPDTFLKQYPIIPATLTVLKDSAANPMLFHQMRRDMKAAGLKFISAMRDITAAEWGDLLADTSTSAVIQRFKLKCSIDEIDTCSKCGEKFCGGAQRRCFGSEVDGNRVQGCEQEHYGCERSHYTILTCDNPECLRVNEVYRQCVGHTCIFP